MKQSFYFTCFLYIGVFLLLTACEDSSSSDKGTTTTATLSDDTIETIQTPTLPPVMDTVSTDTISLDTIKKVQKMVRPTREPAKIKFETTSYTYDTIQQGEIVEYSFKFKNVGERPLAIKDVKGSCGCTIGSYPFLDIVPQEESTIKARFDSKGKKGPQFTTITVYSNANPQGDVLSLKGVVLEE